MLNFIKSILLVIMLSHKAGAVFDNAHYVLASRQVAVFNESKVISNNIANKETPGFKVGKVIYKQHPHHASNKDKISFNYDVLSVKDFSSGEMRQTGNALDLALVGNGFFRIASPAGERYTRAGNFQIDSNGQIVTAQGYPLLNEDGEPIILAQDLAEVEIRENGAITTGPEQLAVIGMAFFSDEQYLLPEGNYLYKALTPPVFEGEYVLYQGVLETSNVNMLHEMTNMQEIKHNLDSAVKNMQYMDQMERDSFKIFAQNY
jgi:flagellar basal-body rod protein FlgF